MVFSHFYILYSHFLFPICIHSIYLNQLSFINSITIIYLNQPSFINSIHHHPKIMETKTKFLLSTIATLQAIILFFLFNSTPQHMWGVNFVSMPFHKTISLPTQPDVPYRQYSGYISVDKQKNRYLFYYFVEAESGSASKPVVLWFNGGRGCSSLVEAFGSNGPFTTTHEGLVKNPHSWNQVSNMLYLESPVGVGFTFSFNYSDQFFKSGLQNFQC